MLVLTTATLRPDLLRTTYASFRDRLFGGTFPTRVAVNVDPVGEAGVVADDVVAVTREFAPLAISRCPPTPSLPRAWMWLLDQITPHDEFVVWLEDDWIMTRDVDVADMVRIMRAERRLAVLRLSRFDAGEHEARQWSRAFPRDGDVYRCPAEWSGHMGFSGNPSIFRGAFLREVRPWLVPWGCPEKQLKYPVHRYYGNQELITAAIQERAMYRILPTWAFAVYAKPGWDGTVKDIGERWRRAQGVGKLHGREHW